MNTKDNEDLVHEALAIIYDKYREVEFEKGILPWAYTVLDNVMKSDYQREARRKRILTDNIEKVLEIFRYKESVEDEISFQELVDEIWRAANRLSNKEKEVLKLMLEGHFGNEIQNRLDLSENALHVMVHRIRKKLWQELQKRRVL